MTFVDLASAVIRNKISSIENRFCPDQYVGIISSFRADQGDFPVRLAENERPAGLKCLIMIIESPHIEEFIGDPCPAKGKTGQLIRKWIRKVPGLSAYGGYGLILVNAIQYQCSLGAPTRCFRDDVFKAAWREGGEEAFIERLKGICRNGDAIANCCTNGNIKKTELRQLVQAAITKIEMRCPVHRRTHPSSWYSEKNRKYEWMSA